MIEIRNLHKAANGRTALQIERFSVHAGEIAALVGPAGSGKRMLMDLLLGKVRPSSGTVRVAGIDPRIDRSELSLKVGALYFEDGLYGSRTCQGNLLFQCSLYGLPSQRADEVLMQVGLADQARAKADALPSGMQRRLALGRAILHHPRTLILEEPLARCDEASISIVRGLVEALAAEGVATLILAAEAASLVAFCHTIRALTEGRLGDVNDAANPPAEPRAFKIPVRLEGSVALVNPADIFYAQAEGGRAYLHTTEGRMPTQYTLAEVELRLQRSGFFRAHRSYLVNLQRVKEVIPFTRNSFNLRLNDAEGTLIPLSKSAAGELRELLGY